jgi:predicted DNA-binding transcriptional regulator AlpA
MNAPHVPVIAHVPCCLYDHGNRDKRRGNDVVYDEADLERRLAAGEGLRLGEVAALTKLGRTTLHDWIKDGRWKPRYTITLGGWRRFRAEDVRSLLDQLRTEAYAPEPDQAPSEPPASAD